MIILPFTLVAVINLCQLIPGTLGAGDFHETLGHLKARSSPEVQAQAVRSLIERLVGDDARFFVIDVDPNFGPEGKDTFRVRLT